MQLVQRHPGDCPVETTARAAKPPREKKYARLLLLSALVVAAVTVLTCWAATRLTDAERRLIGVWHWRHDGTSLHHQFHLREDHSYTETTWSDGEWHEVVSGRWDANDGALRLHENWNDSIVAKLEWRWKGRNVAVLQIQQQEPDRMVLQCRGSSRMVWTRSARGG